MPTHLCLRHLSDSDKEAAPSDVPDAYLKNRELILEALGLSTPLYELKQVHGDRVVSIPAPPPITADDTLDLSICLGEADGLLINRTACSGLLGYADCVPLILVAPVSCGTKPHGAELCILHSGWKGTQAHIIRRGIESLAASSGAAYHEMNLYIGPHIAGKDYRVSVELYQDFAQEFSCLNPKAEPFLPLMDCIKEDALLSGLQEERIAFCGGYTSQEPEHYFSFRFSGGICGRLGALGGIISQQSC